MSKEERIQEQVAAVERIRKAHGVTVFEREDGEDIDVLLRDCGLCIDTKELTKACGILWKALIAAETKLEPQTVAEPTAREWREANGFPVTHWRQHPGENLVENNFHLTPEQFDEALTAFAHIHSPAPDTKGMAEQIAKRVESWATGSNTHVSTVFAIARDIRNAYGLPTDTPTEAK